MIPRHLRNFMLILCCTVLLLVGCDSSPSTDQQYSETTNLALVFPVMERLQLMEYRTGAQEVFHYRRGTFSQTGRTYFDQATGKPRPFPAPDAEAKRDLAELESAIAQTGVRLTGITGTRYALEKLSQAEFNLPSQFTRFSYIYSVKGVSAIRQTSDQQITPVKQNWYFRVEDWN